jgi:hypothetical protein
VDVPATEVALQVRTFFALAARYAVMALTSYGVSAFQQPAPPGSWADPWAAVGLLLVMAVAARWGVGVRARRNEAVAWTLVGAAYLPVSQIVPFPFPFADHYLYPMLPGVIGAVALLLSGALDRVGKDVGPGRALAARLDATPTQLITALALIALCGVFAARAHARAGLFRSAQTLSEDAARHYPDGREASLLAAWQAAREGDAATAARSLRRAADQGYRSFGAILSNPAYAGVRDDPAVRAVIEDMAAFWIARAEQVESPTQLQLRTFSNAHYVRGELEQSIHLLERALALGGPADEEIAADLDSRRLELRLSERLGRPYGGLR